MRGTVDIEARSETFRKSVLMHDVLGSAGLPMPPEMIEAKFLRLTEPEIGAWGSAALFDALASFESITDANDLADMF